MSRFWPGTIQSVTVRLAGQWGQMPHMAQILLRCLQWGPSWQVPH